MMPAVQSNSALLSLFPSAALNVFAAVTDGIVLCDLHGNVMWMNSAALHTHGFSDISEAQRPIQDYTSDFALFLPEGLPVPMEDWPLCRILRGETLNAWEVEVRQGGKGRSFFASYSGQLAFSEDGVPQAAVIVIRDLTQSKGFERDLKNSEEQRLIAFEAADMGAWRRDLQTDKIQLSSRARQQLGFREGQPVTMQDLLSAIHPGDRQHVSAAVETAIREHSYYEAEYRVIHPGGTEYWIACRGRASYDTAGSPVSMHGVLIDITDRRRNQEELLTVQRQFHHSQKLDSLGVLAGGVAHDFNNLLTGILGNTSLVLDGLAVDDPSRLMLEEVIHAGERAADLTRQLLAYAGKGRFVTRLIHLPQLVREMHRLISTSIPKNVHLVHHLPATIPAMEGDPSQIQQVVMNLILNAAEAIETNKPGTVLVEAASLHLEPEHFAGFFNAESLSTGHYVVLKIHDTGSGFDEATKSQIFDPFFTTKFTGRGLGLSAVLGIVRGHRGALQVQSTPGQGTSFTVVFPVAPNQPAVVPPNVLGGSEMVLAIGPCTNQMSGLRDLGYPVLFCPDLRMANAILHEGREPVAVVICSGGDEDLPAVIHRYRPGVQVILSSPHHPAEQIRKYPGQHFSAFLHESASTFELDRAIRQALAR